MDNYQLKQQHIQDGLPGLKKYEQIEKHPVNVIQDLKLFADEEERMKNYARLYGTALPMQLTIERNIAAQSRRFGGEKQSLLSLKVLMNKQDQMDWEDFLGEPEQCPEMPKLNAHEQFLRQEFN